MVRWGLAVVTGLMVAVVLAWNAGRQSVPDPAPAGPTPQVERTPDRPKTDPLLVPGVRAPERPQIIERERITERADDDDDDQPAPRVTVVVPRQSSGSTQRPTQAPKPAPTTRAPLKIPEIEIPEIPEVKVPDLNTPLLP